MRAVIQRVSSASVIVDNEVISSIGRGLMVLVGIGSDDTTEDLATITNKILTLRVFSDVSGVMWKKSVKDIDGDVLCVSQFTLLANTTKGNKPDFHRAMATEPSRQMYSVFLDRMRSLYKYEKIQDGHFGAMMNVSLTNEGPVTFTLDSRKFEYVDLAHKAVGKRLLTANVQNATEGMEKASSRSDEPPAATAGDAEVKGNLSTGERAAE